MRCNKCGIEKPAEQIIAQSLKGTRREIICKPCYNAYSLDWRQKNKKRWLGNVKKWRDKNKERLSEYNKQRRLALPADKLEALRKNEATKARRLNANLKNEAFVAYGGWICACCGETEPKFLTIDHLNNDGGKFRRDFKQHGHGSDFHRWLKKGGYPKEFQILCMNCNFGKGQNGGICPHQTRVTTIPEGSTTKRSETQQAQNGS